MSEIIEFPTKRAKVTDVVIALCIKENRSIIIGTSYPQFTLDIMRTKFPNATFKLHEYGVELCKKNQ